MRTPQPDQSDFRNSPAPSAARPIPVDGGGAAGGSETGPRRDLFGRQSGDTATFRGWRRRPVACSATVTIQGAAVSGACGLFEREEGTAPAGRLSPHCRTGSVATTRPPGPLRLASAPLRAGYRRPLLVRQKMPFRATSDANWSSFIRIVAKMVVIRRRNCTSSGSRHTQRARCVPYGESRIRALGWQIRIGKETTTRYPVSMTLDEFLRYRSYVNFGNVGRKASTHAPAASDLPNSENVSA